VLDWILRRSFGEIDAVERPIGWLPKPEDINLEGLDGFPINTLKNLLSVDEALWKEEVRGIHAFYAKLGDKLPAKLKEELTVLGKNLN